MPVPHAPRVLVFDSGVGALSIGTEIHRLLPDVDLLYCMDRGGFPYGDWQEQDLVRHICQQILTVLTQQSCDLLVVACNSASTAVLPALRQQLSIPVVGVVPAIKPAAEQSRSGVIGLLATPGTIARPYTAQLITDFASHCTVIPVGEAHLARAVEDLFWYQRDNPSCWHKAITAFSQHPDFARMDTLVLACTHFPLVQAQLAEALLQWGKSVNWIDSGKAIARRVSQLLQTTAQHRQLAVLGRQQALILGAETATAPFSAALAERGIELLTQD